MSKPHLVSATFSVAASSAEFRWRRAQKIQAIPGKCDYIGKVK